MATSNRLRTRERRTKLPVGTKPQYETVETGLDLGYRRLSVDHGTWVARRYSQATRAYVTKTLGAADTAGKEVIGYDVAANEAKSWRNREVGTVGPLKVADAFERLFRVKESAGQKGWQHEQSKIKAVVLPVLIKMAGDSKLAFGDIPPSDLRDDHLDQWRIAYMRKADASDPDKLRARRNSCNRLRAVIRSALVTAKIDPEVYANFKPFKKVNTARPGYLKTPKQVKDLIEIGCKPDPDFGRLCCGALNSGARYSELAAVRVKDFYPDENRLHVVNSKTGGPRDIYLTAEATAFFRAMVRGRNDLDGFIFRNKGERWGESHQVRRMRESCARAKIVPAITFHGLRHTYATWTILENKMPLLTIAKNLGHSTIEMVQLHYGHITPTDVQQAFTQHGPRFGLESAE